MSLIRREWLPTFIEISLTPVGQPKDDRDQGRHFALWGYRALGIEPFELDRWADDGGSARDGGMS